MRARDGIVNRGDLLLPDGPAVAYPPAMSQAEPSAAALARIVAAIARIEAAAAAKADAGAQLERRHAALRARIAEAVAELDALLPVEAR